MSGTRWVEELRAAVAIPGEDPAVAACRRAGAAAATTPRVDLLESDDPRFDDLVNRRGPLYDSWLETWNALADTEKDALTHPAWLTAWLHATAQRDQAEGRDQRLALVRREARVLTAVPFEVRPLAATVNRYCALVHSHAGVLGGASLAIHSDMLIELVEALFRTDVPGAGRPLYVRFEQVDEGNLLLYRAPRRHVHLVQHRSVLDTRRTHPELIAGLSRNFQSSLRKARNKLARHGDVVVEHVADPGALAAAWARFVQVDVRSWKHRAGTDLGSDATMRRFLEIALGRLGREQVACVSMLRVGDMYVGGQLALRFGRTLHVVKTTYDEGFAAMAPGNVVLNDTLRCACEDPEIDEVSLVTSLEWHDKWRPRKDSSYEVNLFAPGWAGVPARLLAVPLRRRLGRALRGAPPP